MSATLEAAQPVTPKAATPRAGPTVRTVAIAGNPNSGKSTLFNALTGLRQKVGNYPGVTVEKRIGRFHGSHGEPFDLLDLPGTYSLQTRAPDEAVARDVLLGRRDDTPAPEVILCVVDATNLERNLYLVAQLAEIGLPLVVALVMVDLAERNGLAIHASELSRRLGCPVVPTVAAQGKGLVELRQAITGQLPGSAPHRAALPAVIENGAWLVRRELERAAAGRFALAEALWLVTGTNEQAAGAPSNLQPVLKQARRAIEAEGLDPISAAVHARYAWVETIVEHAVRSRTGAGATLSERLDGWFTHKVWGWVFFLGVMAVMLPATFSTWHKAGLMLALYWLGLVAAFGMAWLFRRTLFKGERSLLLLEMPPYRRPSLRVTLARMWERSNLCLRQAGTVILAISVIIWALSTYPKPADPKATPSQALAHSVAGRLGHLLEPVISPLGYDWKIGLGIISSFAAREVFVGTMSVIYSIENGGEDTPALREATLGEKRSDGSRLYTPLVCLSLMVFYVLAMQCLSTVAVVRRETHSWEWPLFQLGYMTLLAWLGAFLVFQGGRLLGFS